MLKLYVTACTRINIDKRAVTAIEYALIAALIAITIIGALKTLSGGVTTTFGRISNEL